MQVIERFRKDGNAAAQDVAVTAIADAAVLTEVLAATRSDSKRVKNVAAKTVALVSRQAPEVLYGEVVLLLRLASSDDSILKWNAALAVGDLAAVDAQRRIDGRVVTGLIGDLGGDSIVTAANTIAALAAIARHKPRLRRRIVGALLDADYAPLSADCRAILAGKTLLALGDLTDLLPDRAAVRGYAEKQRKSRRNATRKKAEQLLERLR